MTEPDAVYAHPNGTEYVALFGEDGWFRWPACSDGWAQRKPCPPTTADDCTEYDARQAWLALRLSGVPL